MRRRAQEFAGVGGGIQYPGRFGHSTIEGVIPPANQPSFYPSPPEPPPAGDFATGREQALYDQQLQTYGQQTTDSRRRDRARHPFLGVGVGDTVRAEGAGSLPYAIRTFASQGLVVPYGAGPYVTQLPTPSFGGPGPGPGRGPSGSPGAGGNKTNSLAAIPIVGGPATVAALGRLGQQPSRVAAGSRRGGGGYA
jgi:hypothetical protein